MSNFDDSTKSPGMVIEYTKDMHDDLIKCSNDAVYFIENYCWIQGTKGKMLMKLFDYQKEMITNYQNYKNVVSLTARQMGKH